jgi:PKD repeat protein
MTLVGSQFEEGKPIDAQCLTAGKSFGSAFHWSVYREGVDKPYDESSGDDSDRFTFVPEDNGRYRLVMVATAPDGNEKRLEQTIEVANVAPTVTIEGIGYPRQEGTAIEMLANARDPAGTNDTLTYSWSVYGKGATAPLALKENVNFEEFSFTPPDNGSYKVVLKVRDEDGGEATVEKDFEVENLPPKPVIGSISSICSEGTPIDINGKATDPAGQNDRLTYHWSAFKGNSRQAIATDSGVDRQDFCFTPDDDGRYRVVLEVSDEDGGSSSVEKPIDVVNVAPSASIVSVSPQCREGAQIQVDAKVSDPAGTHDTITYQWKVSLVGSTEILKQQSGTSEPSFSFIPKDNGTYRVTLKVSDEDGGSAQIQRTIDVDNALPEVAITAPAAETAVPVKRPIAFAGTFSDAGVLDTHTATWSFLRAGSNQAESLPATIEESGGHGTARVTKAFAVPGIYTLKLTVTDNDQGQSSAEKVGDSAASVIAIDPSWGPVHAVGKSSVPQNALVEEPNRSAVAKLQFDAEYSREGTVATGVLRFQPGGSTFDFQSRRLDWLMVDQSKAEVKGQGTISGKGDFIFRLSLVHTGKPEALASDRFRLRIWDASTGRLVYDQQPGANPDAEPSGKLSGSLTFAPRR